MISSKSLIKNFDLKKHPEGGYFKEIYRSSEAIPKRALPSRYKSSRSFCTSIYFLLPSGAVSRLHRIASDEIWHFYMGRPLELIQISTEGIIDRIILGQDIAAGQRLQHVVPAGNWFGARPMRGSGYSFVGCTVAPGFDFADFAAADEKALSRKFPHLQKEIRLFCRRSS
jgi:predicted cupin superfamily sugar epimerase